VLCEIRLFSKAHMGSHLQNPWGLGTPQGGVTAAGELVAELALSFTNVLSQGPTSFLSPYKKAGLILQEQFPVS